MTFASGYSYDDQSAQSPGSHGYASHGGDAMEAYFTCITTCSLDDGSCLAECVETYREQQ